MAVKPRPLIYMVAATACGSDHGRELALAARVRNPPPKTVLAAGFLRAGLEAVFASCAPAGHVTIPYGIENSAIGDRADIFVCGTHSSRGTCYESDFNGFGRA